MKIPQPSAAPFARGAPQGWAGRIGFMGIEVKSKRTKSRIARISTRETCSRSNFCGAWLFCCFFESEDENKDEPHRKVTPHPTRPRGSRAWSFVFLWCLLLGAWSLVLGVWSLKLAAFPSCPCPPLPDDRRLFQCMECGEIPRQYALL